MFLWPHSSSEPRAEPAESAGRCPFVLKAHSSSSSRPVLSHGPWGPPGQGVPRAADHPTWAWRTWRPGFVCPTSHTSENQSGRLVAPWSWKVASTEGKRADEGRREVPGDRGTGGLAGCQTEVQSGGVRLRSHQLREPSPREGPRPGARWGTESHAASCQQPGAGVWAEPRGDVGTGIRGSCRAKDELEGGAH